MKRFLALLITILFPINLQAFSKTESLGKGIHATISLNGSGDVSASEAAKKAFEEGRRVLSELEGGGSGEIAQINQVAGKDAVKLSDRGLSLLRACQQIAEWTGGLFDVVRSRSSAVKDPQLEVSFANNEVKLPDKTSYLDFSGIRTGYVIDRMAGVLHASGYSNLMVKIGENYRTMGRNGDESWRVSIPDPGKKDRPLCRASIQNISMATVASRDSKDKSPDLGSVTVVTKNATHAVALAAAGFRAGKAQAQSMFSRITAKGFGAILEDQSGKITTIGDVTAACFESQ